MQLLNDNLFLGLLFSILIISLFWGISWFTSNDSINVIRIEHDDGRGPFNTVSAPSLQNIVELKDLYNRHFNSNIKKDVFLPSPFYDSGNLNLLKNNKSWFCAFKSIKQFNSLFTIKEISTLLKFGYNILYLKVTNYQIGGTQVLYTKESIVTKKNINHIFI